MRVLAPLRRVLDVEVTIAGLLEFAMWLAVPHILIGVVFTFLQPDYVIQFEKQLVHLPAGAHLVAFGESVLLWPVLLIAPQICAV